MRHVVGSRAVAAATRLAPVCLSALLYAWSFGGAFASWLAWVALVPLLLALDGESAGARAATGFLFGLAVTAACAWDLPRAASVYYFQPGWVGLAVLLVIAMVTVAPFLTVFALLHPAARGDRGAAFPFVVAAAWAGTEWLRVGLPWGSPWMLLGYSQAGLASLRQVADLTGTYGISFAVVAVNALVAGLLLRLVAPASGAFRRVAAGAPGVLDAARATEDAATSRMGSVALVVALLLCVHAYGRWRLASGDLASSSPGTVAIVQADLDSGAQWRAALYGTNLDSYLLSTAALVRDHPGALVLWPENAMTFFAADEPLFRASIARVLAAGASELVAGGPRRDGDRVLNAAFLLRSDGQIAGAYDKRVLLPLAEYFPAGSAPLARRDFGRAREFTAGASVQLLPTLIGRAGVALCNEAFFPGLLAQRVALGAQFLVILANDTWFADETFGEQAWNAARMRAVEQRRFLVRVSTSGPSGIFDAWGNEIARTPSARAAQLAGTIHSIDAPSPYSRLGDSFAMGCLLLATFGRWRAHRKTRSVAS